MSAGPYKHNSCMSAYCVDAQKMADAAGMLVLDQRRNDPLFFPGSFPWVIR